MDAVLSITSPNIYLTQQQTWPRRKRFWPGAWSKRAVSKWSLPSNFLELPTLPSLFPLQWSLVWVKQTAASVPCMSYCIIREEIFCQWSSVIELSYVIKTLLQNKAFYSTSRNNPEIHFLPKNRFLSTTYNLQRKNIYIYHARKIKWWSS